MRDLIVRGHLAPGTRIIETELAQQLGLSRTPVRSALHRLLQEGFVIRADVGRRARLMVAPLTKDDGAELLDILAEVEGLAARYAAQLAGESRGRLAAELRALNADLVKAAEEGADGNRYYELDLEFHRCYVEAAAHARVLALYHATRPQAERYIRVYTSALADRILTSVQEHEVIIAAIERGDPDAAQRAVQTNYRNAAQRLNEVIDAVGEWGSWQSA